MTHTAVWRSHLIDDRDLYEWVTDAIPTAGMCNAGQTLDRLSRAVPGPTVRLYRGARDRLGGVRRGISSWTPDRAEAARWGRFVVARDIQVTRVLAVVHFPGTGTTEYVVAGPA